MSSSSGRHARNHRFYAWFDRHYQGKYFSVSFNELCFVIPLLATVLMSLHGLVGEQWTPRLIVASVICAIAGTCLVAIQKMYSSGIQADVDSAKAAFAAIDDGVRHVCELLAQRFGIDQDTHARVTAYATAVSSETGSSIFCPIARFSFNGSLAAHGRSSYPCNEGVLAEVWEGRDGGRVFASFPADKKAREERYQQQYSMSTATIDALTMEATSMLALRLEYDHRMVGALMFETDDPEHPFESGQLHDFENDVTLTALIDILSSQLYASRGCIEELIHHKTLHDQPMVHVSRLETGETEQATRD